MKQFLVLVVVGILFGSISCERIVRKRQAFGSFDFGLSQPGLGLGNGGFSLGGLNGISVDDLRALLAAATAAQAPTTAAPAPETEAPVPAPAPPAPVPATVSLPAFVPIQLSAMYAIPAPAPATEAPAPATEAPAPATEAPAPPPPTITRNIITTLEIPRPIAIPISRPVAVPIRIPVPRPFPVAFPQPIPIIRTAPPSSFTVRGPFFGGSFLGR